MEANWGIQPLKLDMPAGDRIFDVHATVLWDENEAILVDTGIPGQLELIRSALAQQTPVSFESLTKVIITHHDRDHIGGLPELTAAAGDRLQVLAHELGKPFIQGEIPLAKSGTIVPPVKVDVGLHDGDVLPYAGGIQVIFTPGHTTDHICLYHIPSKTLVTGDLFTSQDGVLQPFNLKFTPDPDTALQSMSKLQHLDIETVITYHGGVCTDRIKERMQEIRESGVTKQPDAKG
jgi:glyoxylase-like metal-dependent hydrolase (beta-lactamase superfamily II)